MCQDAQKSGALSRQLVDTRKTPGKLRGHVASHVAPSVSLSSRTITRRIRGEKWSPDINSRYTLGNYESDIRPRKRCQLVLSAGHFVSLTVAKDELLSATQSRGESREGSDVESRLFNSPAIGPHFHRPRYETAVLGLVRSKKGLASGRSDGPSDEGARKYPR